MDEELERYTIDALLAPPVRIRVIRQELRRVDVHWHEFYEMAFVLEGTACHLLNGEPETLQPGSAFLLTPADFHRIDATSEQPLTCLNVVIDPGVVEQQLLGLLASAADWSAWPAWTLASFDEAREDFLRLWDESQAQRPGAAALTDALVGCILIAFARRCAGSQGAVERQHRPRPDSAIARAVLFVDHHFREPVTLAHAAAQAHLSPNYFSERFREFTGIPFQVYLQQRRLRFARSLLAATDLGVTEVCHAAGFNSPSHFGRAYRRRYGQSPSAARAVRNDWDATGDASRGSLDNRVVV